MLSGSSENGLGGSVTIQSGSSLTETSGNIEYHTGVGSVSGMIKFATGTGESSG